MFMFGFAAGFLTFLSIVLGIAIFGDDCDFLIFEKIKDSIQDKHIIRKERKRINTLNEKYKTGMVVGVFTNNPYDDVPYWLVTSERFNINGEKYVELKSCDKYGNYKDTAKPLVFSVTELYCKKYVVAQNKK